MGLKEVYSNLEDKWYSFLDSLDAKGIPVYKIIDPLENAGIPSFPLVLGVVTLIILGLVYVGMSSGGGVGPTGGVKVTVNAMDTVSGTTLEGASIVAEYNGEQIAIAKTGSSGAATLTLPSGKQILIRLSKKNCEKASKLVIPKGPETITIQTQCSQGVNITSCLNLSPNLKTISLQDSNGYPAKNCQILINNRADPTDVISVDWYVDGEGNLHLSEPGTCPTQDYEITIDCDNAEYNATWNQFLNDIKMGTIVMKSKISPKPPIDKDNSVTIPVCVYSKDNVPLAGIVIKAVDEDGEDIAPGVDGVTTQGQTDALGCANLILPKGQEFYVSTEDPNGAYFSRIVGSGNEPFIAGSTLAFSGITVILDRGYETYIAVKENATQTPVVGAIVTVKYQGKVIATPQATDSAGITKFVLLRNRTYDVEVRHPRYGTQTGQVTGSANITIWMETVDLSKVGNLELKIISSHGMQEPLAGVRIKLMKGNVTYAEKTTNDAGLVKFEQIEESNYSLFANPPGSVAYQNLGSVGVQAGNTTQKTLQVEPTQIRLTVVPLICIHPDKCVPKENVHVELWNSWFEEKVDEKDTGPTRKVTFTVDYGTPYWIVASWVDPDTKKKFGPVMYKPAGAAYQDKEIDIKVGEQTSETEVSVFIEGRQENDTLEAGRMYNALVSITLPEFAPGTKFKEIDIEIFTGDAGSLTDTRRTPLAIGDISLTDISTQDPIVADLFKADEYYYGKQPRKDNVGLSKYIKIILGQYKNASQYTAEIPIYVKAGATGIGKINYRAKWITPDGREIQSNQGLWETKVYKLASGESGTNALQVGPFYSYNSWLSTTKNGKHIASAVVTNGSYVYVHFMARARDDVNNWVVDFKSVPEKLKPIAFEGTITRQESNKTTYITQQQLNSWIIRNTEGLYSLKKDDVLHGIITMQAMEPGQASIVLFKDVNHPLSVRISEIPALEKDTLIAGITGKLEASWKDMQNSNLYGQINIKKDVLPTDNKYFWLDLTLKNSEKSKKNAEILVKALDDSIKFTNVEVGRQKHVMPGTGTYVQNVSVTVNPSSEVNVRILGEGYSDSLNQMGIFIWERGTPIPKQPWAIINYGPVNFKLAYRYLIKGKEVQFPSESCDEVDVRVIKDTAGQEESLTKLVTVRVNGRIATLTDDYFKATFESGIGRHLDIMASSDYFGKLEEKPDVAYLKLEPEYPNAIDFTHPLPLLNESRKRYINITNYYPTSVHFDVGDVSAKGWEIDVNPSIYAMNASSSEWTKVKNATSKTNIEVLPGQRLVIEIEATPTDMVCRNYQNPILTIKSKDALAEPLGYGIKLMCNNSTGVAGIVSGAKIKPQHVAREPVEPGSITRFSCQYIKDLNVSYLCDSEQLGIAIAKAADELLNDPTTYSATYIYALGNDEVSQATIEEALKKSRIRLSKLDNVFESRRQAKLSSGHDLVFPTKVGCGYITVTLTKFNMDQDVYANVTFSTENATWCDFNYSSYIVGLMNYDRDIRPLLGKYFSFDQNEDNEDMLKAIDEAKSMGNNVTASALFGYGVEGQDPASVVAQISGGQAQSFISWKTCSIDQSTDCPQFAVTYMRTHPDTNIIGYMRIDEYNDIHLGVMYRKDKVPEQNLDRYKVAMVTRLMAWAINGEEVKLDNEYNNNAYWIYLPETDDLSQVVDVKGPTINDTMVYWTDELGVMHTDFAGSLNVTVRITATNDAQYCFVANVMPDGTFTGPKGEGKPQETNNVISQGNGKKIFEYEDWQLAPGLGLKRVATYCIDSSGVASDVGVAEIKLDSSGIELVGKLPDTVLMFEPFQKSAFPFKVMSRYTSVTRCWLEWPNDTNYKPTDGELAAESDQACDNQNKNENSNDGCCYVSGAGTGEIKDANITITGKIESNQGYSIDAGASVLITNGTRTMSGTLSMPVVIRNNEKAYIYVGGKSIAIPGTTWKEITENNNLIGINTTKVTVTWQTASEGLTIYNYFDVTCNSPVIPEGEYNKYLPAKVKCENAAGEDKILGEVNFYEYAPGAPKIFLPQTPFAMGWFNWDENTQAMTLDEPLINGTSYYCNATSSNQCELPTS